MKFKEIIPLVIILVLAGILRLLWLDRVPGAIGGDEFYYILTVKAIALSGHDLSGHWNIFKSLIFSYPTGAPQAELPFFLLFPAVLLFPLSLFSTTLIYALLSVGTVFAIYLLAARLLGKEAGLAAAFICAINPWAIFMGRTIYEVVPAGFFFILAIYFLIKEKGSRILLSFPLFAFAFYSYIGTKLIFLPVVFIVTLFAYNERGKKFARQYLILNAACILLFLFFAFTVSHSPINRTGEIALPGDARISEQVDSLRKNSIAPSKLTNIFDNKFTVYGKILTTKTLESFSVDYLFISGDQFTGLFGHGFFYMIDAVFLVLGACFMFAKKRKVFIMFTSLVLVSTLPHVFHTLKTEIFTPHLVLLLTLLPIGIGYGLSETIRAVKNKFATVTVIAVYTLSAANFLFIYFSQFPLQGHFDFPTREASRYIRLAQEKGKINVFASGSEDFYKKYIYYTDSLNSKNLVQIKKSLASRDYSLSNIRFYPCGDIKKRFDKNSINIYQSSICAPFEESTPSAKISRLDDGGEVFAIYGDKLCTGYNLKPYPIGLRINDFSVENLSEQGFCETFIAK